MKTYETIGLLIGIAFFIYGFKEGLNKKEVKKND